MTAAIPAQRQPTLDTAAVAALLHRTPGYVRLLAHKRVLVVVGVERTPKGATRLLFDARQVFAALDDTPQLAAPA